MARVIARGPPCGIRRRLPSATPTAPDAGACRRGDAVAGEAQAVPRLRIVCGWLERRIACRKTRARVALLACCWRGSALSEVENRRPLKPPSAGQPLASSRPVHRSLPDGCGHSRRRGLTLLRVPLLRLRDLPFPEQTVASPSQETEGTMAAAPETGTKPPVDDFEAFLGEMFLTQPSAKEVRRRGDTAMILVIVIGFYRSAY